jgi:hypothetical protein
MFHRSSVSSQTPPPPPALSFGWLLSFLIDWWPPKAWALPLLFLIFCRSICHLEQRDNTPPHVPPWSRILSNAPPTIDMAFGWWLCPPIKRRPSKAKGPPISLNCFVAQFDSPNGTMTSPPHVPPWSPLYSNSSPIVATGHWLIVIRSEKQDDIYGASNIILPCPGR